jgi:(heptosyl)LPS beta-1,4-glucosyltransferase
MLTAVILTHNESAHINACIESLRFADHILVVDSYSTDDTVVLAQHAGAQVIQRPFQNYAQQRNDALELASGADWVLFIDADERVPEKLADEILTAIENPSYVGWKVPRHNYIFGKLTRGAGWYPDYQLRLLRVGKAHYDPTRQVHEVVVLDGEAGTLSTPIVHYNYRDSRQFVEKQQKYTAYEAKIMYEAGIHPKPQNYLLQPLRHFWWRFVTLKGYSDGLHGLRLSLSMAWYEFRKYLLLRQLWNQKGGLP